MSLSSRTGPEDAKRPSIGPSRALLFAAFVVAGGLLAAACSTNPKPVAGLEMIISTDGLSAPADFDDIKLEISQQSGGSWNKLWDRDYVVPSAEATLPTTFTLRSGQSAAEVLIAVTAYKRGPGGQPTVQRVAQVQVPTDRLAALYLVLAKVCEGQVVSSGPGGEPVSKCPGGHSCQPSTGMCGSNVINSNTLPTYTPGQSLGVGGSPGVDAASPAEAGGSDSSSTDGAPGSPDGMNSAPQDATLGGGDASSGGADAGAPDVTADGSDANSVYNVYDAGDLAPPAASDGLQLVTPDSTVQPGAETFFCYYLTIGSTGIEVGEFQSWTSGANVYEVELFQGGTAQPSGTFASCAFGSGTPIYQAPGRGGVVQLIMPAGVGLPLAASTQLVLYVHFLNTGSTPTSPKAKLNLVYARNVQYQAALMASFNAGINVPPGNTQTVTGTCSVPAGSKFFWMSTHTHHFATSASAGTVNGGQFTEVVHTGASGSYPSSQLPGTGTAWSNPGVAVWTSPRFLTLGAGDSVQYSCSYINPGTTTITVGETAASNEVCEAVGFFYPAASVSCN